jgi:23S rRNA (pseudouridine1915-N3)-methyltransferase
MHIMNIHIICLGKLKEIYWEEAEAEYIKRLSPYAKYTITELKEEPFRGSDNFDYIKEKEAKRLIEKIPPNSVTIALHERGRKFTSREFGFFVEERAQYGETLCFIIGGPLGLHQSLLDRTQFQVSLSDLTFPHQMVRVLLSEQVYRAVTLIKGKTYHY